MNKPTEKQLMSLARILKGCGLTKEETCAMMSLMKTEDMPEEIGKKIERKYPKITHQETMRICAEVIKNHK